MWNILRMKLLYNILLFHLGHGIDSKSSNTFFNFQFTLYETDFVLFFLLDFQALVR